MAILIISEIYTEHEILDLTENQQTRQITLYYFCTLYTELNAVWIQKNKNTCTHGTCKNKKTIIVTFIDIICLMFVLLYKTNKQKFIISDVLRLK